MSHEVRAGLNKFRTSALELLHSLMQFSLHASANSDGKPEGPFFGNRANHPSPSSEKAITGDLTFFVSRLTGIPSLSAPI